jgi:hypothetical protein
MNTLIDIMLVVGVAAGLLGLLWRAVRGAR